MNILDYLCKILLSTRKLNGVALEKISDNVLSLKVTRKLQIFRKFKFPEIFDFPESRKQLYNSI